MTSVAVIGAGITGLAAANRLLELDSSVDVTVFEASERPGGALRTEHRSGYVVEHGPDAILTEKPAALDLAKRLGLGDRIIATRSDHRGAYVVHGGELRPIPNGFSLVGPGSLRGMLKTSVLSARGKARAAIELLIPRRDSSIEEESIAAFVRRRFGTEVLERLAQPLASGVYGGDPERLSIDATLPRFVELERRHGSVYVGLKRSAQARSATGARYGLFASFQGGMQELVDALVARLGIRLRLSTRVQSVDAARTISLADGTLARFDAIVIAIAAPIASTLVVGLDRDLAEELRAIEYGSVATVAMGFDERAFGRSLDAFGFVVPAIEQRRVIASTWLSVKWPGRAPRGKALVRMFVDDPAAIGDSALIDAAMEECRALMGLRGEPEFACIDRHIDAMPHYNLGHLDRNLRIAARMSKHSGIELAGNSYRGVGIPDSIASGERAAERVLSRDM